MAVELVGENPHHTVRKPFEPDSPEKLDNPCWKKQGEYVRVTLVQTSILSINFDDIFHLAAMDGVDKKRTGRLAVWPDGNFTHNTLKIKG